MGLIKKWPGHCWKSAWYGLEMTDFSRFVPGIEAPVLMLWGGLDNVIGEEYRRELKELLPKAKCKVYPENTHELPQEIPGEVFSEIVGFFDSLQ